ncbi:MAG: hypothetical protein ACK5RG_10900 [Cyclobacteriaceae bacterium]|jgi:hypothetical protein|nr:hypothetical protein [Flammeovirgaceae bacterium]
MKIRTHQFHKFWLKITAVVVGSFGPIFFLGTMTTTMEPARFTLDLLSWPIDGITTYQSPDTRFLSALTGGFLLGWGVMIWFLSIWVYDHAPEAVRKSVLIGILSWFFLDKCRFYSFWESIQCAYQYSGFIACSWSLVVTRPSFNFIRK